MESLTRKIRISVLWIFTAVATYRCATLVEPGVIEAILAGEWARYQSSAMLLFSTLTWLIPFIMAFLSVTLKDLANRRTNIFWGIIFTGFNIYHFILHSLDFPTTYSLLIVGLTATATVLIVWYAWKWPKQEVWVIDLMYKKLLDKCFIHYALYWWNIILSRLEL